MDIAGLNKYYSAFHVLKGIDLKVREGERFFMQHLIDGDLAANNGGWQWSSSTGTDSVPYFRIFNPVTQSERFDPEGKFIKHWLPELAELNKKQVHNPASQVAARSAPIARRSGTRP